HSQAETDRQKFLEILRAVTAFWTLWRTSRSTTKGIDDIHRKLMSTGLSGAVSVPAMARRPDDAAQGALPSTAEIKAAFRAILASRGQIAGKQDWVGRAAVQPIYQTAKNLAKFVL